MSIAMELDHSVLLIDADVVKSDVSRLLGIEEAEGLSDFLAQPERALSEFLVKTDIPKLTVLPAGHPRANVTELFASDQMRQLVEEFGRRYTDRIVIMDSPPLLATSGAGVLAHLVGQTVFVVEAVRTPQSAIEEALGQLKSVRNVGLVLNKSRSKDGLGHQYGSYYASSSD
jgi:protein-tyrosine kinase